MAPWRERAPSNRTHHLLIASPVVAFGLLRNRVARR